MAITKELEDIISRIDGVRAVKVVGNNEDIKEVHVIASDGKNPKQVVRDIETAVYALTGFKIDRKVISVAQIAGEVSKKRRIALVDLNSQVNGTKFKVEVTVQIEGEDFHGESEGPYTSSKIPIIIGEALLNALDIDTIAVSVDDVQTARLFNREYVISHVTCNDGKNEWEVIGVAPRREDFERSCANSIIDALEKVI